MISRYTLLSFLILAQMTLRSAAALQPAAGTQLTEDVWVFLTDKTGRKGDRIVWSEVDSHPVEEIDLPVNPEYVRRVSEAVLSLRVYSRWFNAVSVRATSEQIQHLRSREFVSKIQPVRGYRSIEVETVGSTPELPALKKHTTQQVDPSFEQRDQIGVETLHNRGFRGEGIRIALLDNGFHYVGHKAFETLREEGRIVAERDFVNGDDNVADETGQPVTGDENLNSQNIHGAQVLSVMAGDDPGRLVGVAPKAEYILAKTEDNSSELPIEEDRWIAGLEWADSLDARVVNSSLGYTTWDDGSGYSYEKLDGKTALTTQAAAMAAQKGMVVVTAAGNEGNKAWTYITVPADAPDVISVGAVNQQLEIASFSSVGPTADGRIKPDVVALGVGVVVADIRAGDYVRKNGTSFASPLISGVSALLLQINPSWDAQRVAEELRVSATDLGAAGADTVFGWGLVDAVKASGLDRERPVFSSAGTPFPNPAKTGTVNFPIHLADRDVVAMEIFDLSGSLVHEQTSELTDGSGQLLMWQVPDRIANGLYYYRIGASTFVRKGKLALLR